MNDEFDVIIIGAGIGGLVCGNYLSKEGLRVLIIEQHKKVGGYCTSFRRRGFVFDAGVHSLGDFYEDGQMSKLIEEIGLNSDIKFKKSAISDIVLTPEHKWEISYDTRYTTYQLKQYFADQNRGIDNFFDTVNKVDLVDLYSKYYKITFYDALSNYFTDEKLKAIISIPICSLGMSPYRCSAVSAFIIYKRFILGGGYYPIGGMQNFAEVLAKKFISFGGKLLTSQKVTRILIKRRKASGVYCGGNYISGKAVVSNCDARQTFFDLIEDSCVNNKFKIKLSNLRPSLSSLIVFLGFDKKIFNKFKPCTGLWYFKTYDIEKVFQDLHQKVFLNNIKGILCCFPSQHDQSLCPIGKEVAFILLTVPFYNKNFWLKHKDIIAEKMISATELIFGKFSNSIIIKEVATPLTLQKFTLNYQGAMHGWESSPEQISMDLVPRSSKIAGLYLVGHWVSSPSQGGIASVVYSGRKTAETLIRTFRKQK